MALARYVTVVFAALLALSLLHGCARSGLPTPTQLAVVQSNPTSYAPSTFPPTWTRGPATPTNTRVIPIAATLTPGPSPTPTPLPARIKALVVGIQDSRTLEVWIEGQPISRVFAVRLLGVRPPLLSDPWSEVTLKWLGEETGHQVVVLERDERERDEQGNLLRYVWLQGRLVNMSMVALGLATTTEETTSLRFGADLEEAQAEARSDLRGLWGPPPTPTRAQVTATIAISVIEPLTATLAVTPSSTRTTGVTQTPVASLTPAATP